MDGRWWTAALSTYAPDHAYSRMHTHTTRTAATDTRVHIMHFFLPRAFTHTHTHRARSIHILWNTHGAVFAFFFPSHTPPLPHVPSLSLACFRFFSLSLSLHSISATTDGSDSVLSPAAAALVQYTSADRRGPSSAPAPHLDSSLQPVPTLAPSWRWSSRAELLAEVATKRGQVSVDDVGGGGGGGGAGAGAGAGVVPGGGRSGRGAGAEAVGGRLWDPSATTASSSYSGSVPGGPRGVTPSKHAPASSRPSSRPMSRGLTLRPSSSGTGAGATRTTGSASHRSADGAGQEESASGRSTGPHVPGYLPPEPSPYITLNMRLRITQDEVCVCVVHEAAVLFRTRAGGFRSVVVKGV